MTLHNSFVGLILALGIAITAPPASTAPLAPTKTNPITRMIQQQIFNEPLVDEAAAAIPQSTSTRDLPSFTNKNLRVGIQVGHFENENPPAELEWLKGNTGAYAAGKWEKEVAGAIAVRARDILEKQGVVVDILPAVIPPGYKANAYVSVHTDGSDKNPKANGFKVASSAKDRTGLANKLAAALDQAYEKETGMRRDNNNITRNMTHHYSFAYHKYEHAISSRTPGALLETGFLTNASDRKIIVDQPEIPARALAYGILDFLEENF